MSVVDEQVYEALVLGGGFGGMHMLWELRERGFSVIGLEAGANVGGVWYWNRYPGARCDVESLVYSYSFSPIIDAEWRWSDRYAGQKEIRAYLSWVCDRLDIRKDYRFNAKLTQAHYDAKARIWNFKTQSGDTFRARTFISSAGPISAPIWPEIADRALFKAELYHTALWPQQEPDFAGKRVAVIGTGSSGTQVIPIVAEAAGELTVFLRTPNYNTPAFNKPLTDEDYARWEQIRDKVRAGVRAGLRNGGGDVFLPDELREVRQTAGAGVPPEKRREMMERRWEWGGGVAGNHYQDMLINAEINEENAEFLRERIRSIVKDPVKAEMLSPRNFAVGTKRLCINTNYYETFNRDNVRSISVQQTPIKCFTEKGLIVDGQELEFDVILCASGFDALTGALTVIDIRGLDGCTIKETWSVGSPTYLGIGVAGFPNMLMIGGPGSPSVLTNVVMTNELQVSWIADLLCYARDNGWTEISVEPDAQTRWAEHVNDLINGSLLEKAESWYVGANVKGKARGILAYTGGLARYMGSCNEAAEQNYKGFHFT